MDLYRDDKYIEGIILVMGCFSLKFIVCNRDDSLSSEENMIVVPKWYFISILLMGYSCSSLLFSFLVSELRIRFTFLVKVRNKLLTIYMHGLENLNDKSFYIPFVLSLQEPEPIDWDYYRKGIGSRLVDMYKRYMTAPITGLETHSQAPECARKLGVSTPVLYAVDPLVHALTFEFVEGPAVKDVLLDFGSTGIVEESLNDIATQIGDAIAKMHDGGLIHGDLTTSNMLIRNGTNQLVLIDFGLSFTSTLPEDKAVDLYVLERALLSMHSSCGNVMERILKAYRKSSKQWSSTLNKLAQERANQDSFFFFSSHRSTISMADALYNTHVKLLASDFLALTPKPTDPSPSSINGKTLSRAETVGYVVTRELKPDKFLRRSPPGVRSIARMASKFAAQVQVGAVARVRGRITEFRGFVQITVSDVVVEVDPNAQVLHWLDCVRLARKCYGKGCVKEVKIPQYVDNVTPEYKPKFDALVR
ncbi:EKC/KEOPS complex subunit bud32 [Striga asiatica]|uniref:non-specific serine/threonine protein kinase n=1 Tax=Striga asiatica TaxID=4170 RepID=A0A5A7RBQ4_STRAF|nr:EKC/KEOPS complex subunit bud32 [Striga asiatica]